MMLDKLANALHQLGINHRRVETKEESGKDVVALAFESGKSSFMALDRAGHLLFVLAYKLREEDIRSLSELEKPARDRAYLMVARSILSGRTGHSFKFRDAGETRELVGVSIQQGIALREGSEMAHQRILDALQEMLIAAAICRIVLGQEVADARAMNRAAGEGPGGGPGMYA